MKSTSYNKSEIMKQAWMMFQNKFYGFNSFGEALRRAWYYAKQEVEIAKQREARMAAEALEASQRAANKVETKRDSFYKNFNRRNNAAYRNVRFGRNDWAVDYRRY